VGDVSVAEEVPDALPHWHPLGHRSATTANRLAHPEVLRVVDDGFDPERHACLVVHLDPVLLDAMLDANAGDPFVREIQKTGAELALELPDGLPSQEAHHFPGAKALGAVAQQSWVQLLEVAPRGEQDVGRVLALGGDPVVGVAGQQVAQQRVHLWANCSRALPGAR
jgi:hypothetical protein